MIFSRPIPIFWHVCSFFPQFIQLFLSVYIYIYITCFFTSVFKRKRRFREAKLEKLQRSGVQLYERLASLGIMVAQLGAP